MRPINWIDEQFDFKSYDTAWVGYASSDRERQTTSHFGMWIGYSEEGVIASMRYKFREDRNVSMLRRLHGGLYSVYWLMENFHTVMGRSQVFINCRKVVPWFQDSTYLKLKFKYAQELKFYLSLLAPKIESYDPYQFPYSTLREVTKLQIGLHGQLAGRYETFADLNEVTV